jgi:hypothetical protein
MLVVGIVLVVTEPGDRAGGVVPAVLGGVFFTVGTVVALRARAKGRRAAWLRVNGLSLEARIVDAQTTGTEINDQPVMRFALQVAGPQGPYMASFTKLVPPHQVAMLMGRTVRVRANPGNLSEVILEE